MTKIDGLELIVDQNIRDMIDKALEKRFNEMKPEALKIMEQRIEILEEALDTRQAVYDRLFDDYTKLLVKSKQPKIMVEMALGELRKLAGMLRAQKYDPQLDHAREYLSGIEHAIATVEDYLGDVLK